MSDRSKHLTGKTVLIEESMYEISSILIDIIISLRYQDNYHTDLDQYGLR